MAVGYKIYLHTNTDQPERHKYKMIIVQVQVKNLCPYLQYVRIFYKLDYIHPNLSINHTLTVRTGCLV
jgi:hypothetical protein